MIYLLCTVLSLLACFAYGGLPQRCGRGSKLFTFLTNDLTHSLFSFIFQDDCLFSVNGVSVSFFYSFQRAQSCLSDFIKREGGRNEHGSEEILLSVLVVCCSFELRSFTSLTLTLIVSLCFSLSPLRSKRSGPTWHRPRPDRRSGCRGGLCHPVFNHCSWKIPGQA